MSTRTGAAAYAADDLLWARDAYGTAHMEIDPWGNLVVSPASPQHERVIARLIRGLYPAAYDAGIAMFTGLGFVVRGGSGYLNVPDLLFLGTDQGVDVDNHLVDPPLLVVEVASPSTRSIDRTRKLADYRLLGARAYLLVDVPGLAPVDVPTLELRRPGAEPVVSTDEVTVDFGGRHVTLAAATLG